MAATRRERSGATVAVALLLLLVTAACRPSASAGPFAAAQEALRRGALDEALAHVERGLSADNARRDVPAAHLLRLLQAEILLARPDITGAAALADVPIPDQAEFAVVRARQQYVRARIQ